MSVGTLLAVAGCSADSTPSAGSSSAAATSSGSASAVAGSAAGLQEQYEKVVRTVLPSVVEVRTSSGLGSGVVYDTRGDIVTNAHVVGAATTFEVRLATSSTTYRATLVGSFPESDLAVVRVQGASGLRPARFGDSTALQPGAIVLAMGNPLGLAGTATDGIVSAVGRTVTEPAESGSPAAVLPDAIQTSASINPGNSGGALVDLAGRVVGIPTLAAVSPVGGGTSAAPGIGFAISSNTVKRVADQLIRSGKVTSTGRAALGATVATVAGADGQPDGVAVQAVTPNGPAAKAGVRPGDVITAINGTAVTDTQSLLEALAQHKPGDTVTLTLTRADGSADTVTVTLNELQAS